MPSLVRIIAFTTLALLGLIVAGRGQGESPRPVSALMAPSPEEVAQALELAATELIRRQESYRSDPPLTRRLADDELDAWRKKEEERLDQLYGEKERGEWPYEGVYRVGRDGRIPSGYRVGGTALVALALLSDPAFEQNEAARAAVHRSLDFVLAAIETDPTLGPGPQRGYDVRGWGHTYGLQLLAEAAARGTVLATEKEQARLKSGIARLLHCLEVNQAPGGGWNYAGGPSASFMTGATLLVLFRVRELGHDVDSKLIDRAVKALEAGRTASRAHAYSGSARGKVPMPASSARSACAELALYLAGEGEVEDLRLAIAGFFSGFDELVKRKSQQGTHEGPYQIAPYYFFFGHYFAARAIEALPEVERPALREQLQIALWKTREADGLWNDRIFPRSKSYSTAMAVMALRAPALGLPPAGKTEAEAVAPKAEGGGEQR